MSTNDLTRPSFAPRNWEGWLSVLPFWVLGWLPRRLGLWLVAPIGLLAFRFARRRREIAIRNLNRCFPEWSEEKKQQVLRSSFDSIARMIVETSWCWSGPLGRSLNLGRVHGMENLLLAEKNGNGVLLVTGHSTCLEIGARIMAHGRKAGGVYRPLRNPVMEWYQNRGRLRYVDFMISKRNAKRAVKTLRTGGTLWYAPDQDFGLDQSAFAPFFGIQTASLLATHRLPKMTGCAVVFMYPVYNQEDGRYDIHVSPALEKYPSNDPVVDLARINAMIEKQVRKAPEQYWWIHRRFKTRPEGEPPFYCD